MRKRLSLSIAVALFAGVIYNNSCANAQTINSVEITNITPNQYIQGIVNTNKVPPGNRPCVVIYAHTNIWYVHPYANEGAGESFSEVIAGKWQIATVQRAFPADKIAVVLYDDIKACAASSPQLNILPAVSGSVLNVASYDLRSAPYNKWYGFL